MDEFFVKIYPHPTTNNSFTPVLLNRIGDDLYWYNNYHKRIIKTDLNFNIIWEFELKDVGQSRSGPHLYYIMEGHTPGEIICYGTFSDWNDSNKPKLFLCKITSFGNLVWQKHYDSVFNSFYQNFTKGLLHTYLNNQYVVWGYYQVLIIDENGDIVRKKGRTSVGNPNNYILISDIEIYSGFIFVLYVDSTLGTLLVFDDNLNELQAYNFVSSGTYNTHGQPRLGKINSKLIVTHHNQTENLGFYILNFSDLLNNNISDFNVYWIELNNTAYSYSSLETYVANDRLYFLTETSSTVNPKRTLVCKVNQNLNGVEWIKESNNFGTRLFTPFSDFLLFTYYTPEETKILKTTVDLASSCVTFTDVNHTFQTVVGTEFQVPTREFGQYSIPDLVNYNVELRNIVSDKIVQICPQTYDLDESTISSSESAISADASSTSLITVQLKDYQGTNLASGGETVVISTSTGTIGETTDNGDGTYTATLTSSTTSGTATLSFTINGETATDTTQVVFNQLVNVDLSTIVAIPTTINADDGISSSAIVVQLKDYAGQDIPTGGETVIISTTNGSLTPTTDLGDGSYVSTLIPFTSPGTALLSFTVNGVSGTDTAQVTFVPAISTVLSTISASPTTINADGISTSTITVQLKDYAGTNWTNGGATVVIGTDQGTLTTTTDNGDGTYTAILTSSNSSGTALLSFTINGENATDTVEVIFEEVIIRVPQSPHLYLQAAGSTGADGSLAGIHLRWLLKRDLIKHLPKGNLATSTANYNKPDDFVQLFRTPYVAVPTAFDLTQPPLAVENRRAVWIYQVNDIKVYLYFRNRTKYSSVRATLNPLTQSAQFMAAYGNELLELESKNELFFSVAFGTNPGASPVVETEVLSVEANTLTADKVIMARKTFTGTAALSNTRTVTENGRSFRFRPTDCEITSITLDFYSTLADSIENGAGWTALGNFSLSTTDSEVFNRLEPTTDAVNGQWPRYNDDAFVNIQNYRDKWNVINPVTQSSIKQTVQDYVTLSNDINNPAALETYQFDEIAPDGATDEENTFELSNLTLLQQAAFDFHVARMLGLGHLDVDAAVQNNDAFVYMAVYETQVSLQNGSLVAEDTEHRYITVPTSKLDERLPLPVNLKAPIPGLFPNNGNNQESLPLTDPDGYTEDGKARFISLFVDEPENVYVDRGFYISTTEFNSVENTEAVFAGIEYKAVGEADWRKPELPNTDQYLNAVPSGQSPHNETVELPLPDEGVALFVHRERATGEHVYGSYGINWFSRAVQSSVQWNIVTTIQPKDQLIPPHNRNALLVVEESPLLLTSAAEQQLLSNILGSDKTLIRLVFDYHTRQELLMYKVTPENMAGATDPLDANAIFPDSQEIFGDEIELYFREELPLNVTGRALGVQDHPTNEVLSIITTGEYLLDSTGEPLTPSIPGSQLSNFVGGVFVLEETEYIIYEVTSGTSGPDFTVYKKQLSDRLLNSDVPAANEELQAPTIMADGMFIAVENLLNASSWGSPNPHPLKVQIGDNWSVHRELVEGEGPDDGPEQLVEKSRGIWGDAVVEEVLQTVGFDGSNQPILEHRGAYKATFSATQLANHPQNAGTHPVQWHNGIVRIRTVGNPTGSRKALDVFKTENIGTANNLVVYFMDNSFSTAPEYDPIQTGTLEVNYYPGYRVYIYSDATTGITENTVLPTLGQGIKYSCFGFRTLGNSGSYLSRISTPTVFFAQEVIESLPPELPVGSLFATRPDSFGKATYTLTTQFTHTPHGVQYYRSEDDAILNALYSTQTVETVKQELGNADPAFLGNRWQNVLGFDYQYPQGSFQTDGLFAIYPEDASGYRLPNPDNESLFSGGETPGNIDPGNMTDRIKNAILSTFTPLTEIPMLYEYIDDNPDFTPVGKPQVVRDRNGSLLDPNNSSEFDMAPMAKIVASNRVQFTDFGLDGTSNNVYFYAVREVGNRMALSEFSPILGPVKLVNTNAPIAPGIKKAVPVLANEILGIPAQMRIEINAYPKVEGIKKIALYRTLSASDALSPRSMNLIREIDLEQSSQLASDIWEITDDFSDLTEIPFGDPLYYRVIVLREIQYTDKDDSNIVLTDYVPSQASKLMVSAIVENENPIAPDVNYTADAVNANFELPNVVLNWEKTAYNPKYLLYKMNNQGQWAKIHEVLSNEQTVSVPLETTDLGANFLVVEDVANDNQNIYHHFKVVVENTAGMISREESILTIP